MDAGDWIALGGVIAALIAIGVGTINWRISHRAEIETRVAAREVQVEVEVQIVAAFSNGVILIRGENNDLTHPPAFESPIPLVRVVIKNKGQVQIIIARGGIRLARTNSFIKFSGTSLSQGHLFPALPYALTSLDSMVFPVLPEEFQSMLRVLKASEVDWFTVDVVDPLDRHYSSQLIKANTYLPKIEPFNVTSNHSAEILISEIKTEIRPLSDLPIFLRPRKTPEDNNSDVPT